MKDQGRKLSTSDIAAASDTHRAEAIEHEQMEHRDNVRPQPVDDAPAPLFANDELNGYRTRWSAIQTGFVDEPRRAVEEADTLVAELMKRLAEVFADERRGLESHWDQSDKISTEDLRIAMRRYRSFFERLLSI